MYLVTVHITLHPESKFYLVLCSTGIGNYLSQHNPRLLNLYSTQLPPFGRHLSCHGISFYMS